MEPLVLNLDKDVQLTVFVPNLLVGATKVDMDVETGVDTHLRLLVIHSLRLSCKAWKTIVDKSVEFNALCLAECEYAMWPNDVRKVCLARKHNLITQFQKNLMWFSNSRHVSSRVSRKILMSELGDLTLWKLAALRDELEMSFCMVEFYGMSFHPGAPYWTCLADRVLMEFAFHFTYTNYIQVLFEKLNDTWRSQMDYLGTPLLLCCGVFIYDVYCSLQIELDTHFCKSWVWHITTPPFSQPIKYFVKRSAPSSEGLEFSSMRACMSLISTNCDMNQKTQRRFVTYERLLNLHCVWELCTSKNTCKKYTSYLGNVSLSRNLREKIPQVQYYNLQIQHLISRL